MKLHAGSSEEHNASVSIHAEGQYFYPPFLLHCNISITTKIILTSWPPLGSTDGTMGTSVLNNTKRAFSQLNLYIHSEFTGIYS